MKLVERWRQPIRMLGMEETPARVKLIGDGRVVAGVEWAASLEDHQRLREGRVCLECGEPLETPFPDVCPLPGCGFEVRARQQREYELRFGGEEWLGPPESLDDELTEMRERHRRLQCKTTGKPRIWLPERTNR